MKTWKPDTCECLVEEIYEGTNIVGGGQVVRKCEDHSTVPDNELYGVLYANPDGENKRKNQVMRGLLGYEGFNLNLQETKTNPDGSTSIDFKNGISVSWQFSGVGKDRVLQITVIGVNLTNNQKTTIRNFCNKKFGTSKVEIL